MPKVPILIVDDELLVAESLRRRLTALGYPVAGIIATGEEAVQAAAQLQPGLILMDIQLAGDLDGVEAADQIKKHTDVPVIYLTAYSDDITLQRAKITEPFGYVLKPYDPDALHIAIETALYKHSMEQKLRRAYEELEMWVQERAIANQRLKDEIAERIKVEQALRESENKLRREASINASMAELAQALIATSGLEDIAKMVLEHARRLTGSGFGCVGYMDQEQMRLVSSAQPEETEESCAFLDKNDYSFQDLWGWVSKNRQPILANDPHDDNRLVGLLPAHFLMKRFLSAPVCVHDELVGHISLVNSDQPFLEDDLIVVQRLASLYAIAINQRRAEQAAGVSAPYFRIKDARDAGNNPGSG